MSRPNILWICSDQQRYDTLGCYGNPWVQTPHIDALATRGTRFERVYCQSPVCTPSRASFLTGRYPRVTRARQNGQAVAPEEVLVTRRLAESGYRCGLAGKLHLSPCNPKVSPEGERRINDGYEVFHWSHHAKGDWPTNAYQLWLKEKGVRYETPLMEGSRFVRTGMPAEHHQTTWCTEMAIRFVEEAAEDGRPWLFSVNFYDPHHPFDPPPELLARYLKSLEKLPLPNFVAGESANKPSHQRPEGRKPHVFPWHAPYEEMTEEEHRLCRAAYWAMIDLIDMQVGRMLEALERTGQLENTLVIFMSDHGEMLGDHGLYLKGPFFYEGAVRVPLVVAGPGVAEGRRCEALAELFDVAPTVLEAAGLEPGPGVQARSLWPLLRGEADRHREDVYCEFSNAKETPGGTPVHATMLRTDRYKLVAVHGSNEGELYDLQADPAETQNLWDAPAYTAAKVEMLKRLCDRIAFTADPLPERVAPW